MNRNDPLSLTAPWIPADIRLPEGQREVVVGDVHGQAFELGELLMRVHAENDEPDLSKVNLTFLGDLIDRGPCSLGAVRMAAAAEAKFGFASSRLVIGNHEAMMLAGLDMVRDMKAADVLEAFQIWQGNGGTRLLEEVDARLPGRMPCHSVGELRALVQEAMTPQGFGFLLSGDTHYVRGNLLLCHAGVHPGTKSLDTWFSTSVWPIKSEDDHWAWIRGPFQDHAGDFPQNLTVVHGHTPELAILARKNRLPELKDRWGVPILVNIAELARPDGKRIGTDGGSFANGVVMAVEFRNGALRYHFAWDPRMADHARVRVEIEGVKASSLSALITPLSA